MHRIGSRTLALSLGIALLTACGGDAGDGPAPGAMQQAGDGETIALTGAGATFPFPIYSKWFNEYGQNHPVRVNYQSIGSGGGIRQITEGTVDFGASDAPMNEEELAKAPNILHLPTVLGAVAVTYDLPGAPAGLKLDGQTVADIFLGTIERWNDPRIARLNPGVNLPAQDILPVYRTDGSGTTYVFTDYLASVSPDWQQRVGTGKTVQWPTGLGAKGNEGVAGQVRQTPGAIGYVELAYAKQTQLPTAALRNQAGEFVQPSVEATSAAAADLTGKLREHPDFRLSLVNPSGRGAYPIASWTYLLVPSNIADCGKARAIDALVRWSLQEGDTFARELDYAPLPDNAQQQVLEKLNTVTCGPNRQPVQGAGAA